MIDCNSERFLLWSRSCSPAGIAGAARLAAAQMAGAKTAVGRSVVADAAAVVAEDALDSDDLAALPAADAASSADSVAVALPEAVCVGGGRGEEGRSKRYAKEQR